MELFSVCSASRSERLERGTARRAATGLAILLIGTWSFAGSVSGSISANGGVRSDGPKHDLDVVVMLDRIGAAPSPPGKAKVAMDQRGLIFLPHVLAIQKGSTVTFLNNDNDQHNVYFLNETDGKTLDIGTYGPGVSVDHRFDVAGSVIVLCKLHLEMAAYIVVSESPWFAAVRLDPSGKGSYSIPNVPAGKYRVTVWHKKLKAAGGAPEIDVPASGSIEHSIALARPVRSRKKK